MALRIGLGLGLSGGVSFSPLSLFAASEPGFWFDPSDISTLFQDTAGTTPVTAAGQSVGLVLDKRLGLVLGPELVTNGDFASGSTGWSDISGAWAVSGGVLTGTSVSANAYGPYSNDTSVVAGRTYRATFTIGVTSGSLRVRVGNTESAAYTQSGTYSLLLVATTTAVTTFQVRAGGSGFTGTIDNISVRELPGNHATQSNSLSCPAYQIDSNGRGYLNFDGTDDSLATGTITPGTDKAQVFAGVRKLSDASQGQILELSASAAANNGAFDLISAASANTYSFRSRGTVAAIATSATSFASPTTNVLTGLGDIAADTSILRVNGAQAATSAVDQGTGNYLAYPAYIGRRGGTSLPFNGRIYSLICRFGPNLTADQIAQTETWVNARTGAY